jgi:hypothetical protein
MFYVKITVYNYFTINFLSTLVIYAAIFNSYMVYYTESGDIILAFGLFQYFIIINTLYE